MIKVIFLKDIKSIARRGDIKEVSPGYAKNFLLPQKMAEIATDEIIKNNRQKQTQAEKDIFFLKDKIKKINGAGGLKFKLKIGKKGEVYDSINSHLIENKLMESGFDRIKVILPKPIKAIGNHFVEINIGKGITEKINALVEADLI